MIVEQGQNLFDVSVQQCGDTSLAARIAELNNISVTDELTPGTDLLMPDPSDPGLVSFLADNNHQPATVATKTPEAEGIGVWYIGLDFIVS